MSDIITGSPETMQRDDMQRFFVKDPKNFSPERNKAIVEKTIEEYEAMRRKKMEEKVDHYGERADAVVTYLKSLDRGHGESNLEKYFGKRMLAYLRGQQIRDQLMSGLTIKDKQGNIIKSGI